MDSPPPSKKNHSGSSSSSALNNFNSNDTFMESPRVQESLYFSYVKTLSPLTIKATRVGQAFQGLNSPPLVFKSPCISRREAQFVGSPQGTQSLGGEISQSENGGNCLGEAPADSGKSYSQQPLLDIDQMYSANQDVEQSTDAAEPSLRDPTQSKKNILTSDRKDGPGDKAEDSLPWSDDSNRVHQEKPAYSEEPEKMEVEKNDFDWGCRDPTNLDCNLAANIFEKQYTHDPLPQLVENYRWDHKICTPHWVPDPLQDVKGCEDFSEIVSTSHVTSENMLQDGSQALNYHDNVTRCIQFGEAAFKVLVSNKPYVKEKTTSRGMKMEPVTASVRLSNVSQGMKPTSSMTQPSTHDKKKLNRTDGGNFEQLIQPPSECKKKKKTSATTDDNGCKVCNCEKSTCLKLYCKCFARGIYCIDPCACHGCYNRPEYEHIVCETRQQIESRDPMAFSTNIVQPNTDKKEDTDLTTPSSARHKRGCNCKMSMCQQNYCECYKANVRCSSACRCEGCKNVGGNEEGCLHRNNMH